MRMPADGRLHAPIGGVRFPSAQAEGAATMLDMYVEVVASGYTRRQYRAGELDLVFWLDRVLVDMSAAWLLHHRTSSAVLRSVFEAALPSDHAPIEFSLSAPSRRNASRPLPRWVAAHPSVCHRGSLGLLDLFTGPLSRPTERSDPPPPLAKAPPPFKAWPARDRRRTRPAWAEPPRTRAPRSPAAILCPADAEGPSGGPRTGRGPPGRYRAGFHTPGRSAA